MASYVYLLKLNNGGIYVGLTQDLKERLDAHIYGRGAEATKKFGVERVLGSLRFFDKATAKRFERAIVRGLHTEGFDVWGAGRTKTIVGKK